MTTPRHRQIWLFLLCAAVLLSAGYGAGYASAYTQFYSVSSVVDRETLDLEFNSRLLRFADANQPEAVRARLFQRLSGQVRYVDQIMASSDDPDAARNAAMSLEHARVALSRPRNLGRLTSQAPLSLPVR